MMRYLSLSEVLYLYEQVMRQSGGTFGLRDLGALESALSQPLMTFAGNELYPSLVEKAASFAFSLIRNHPFIDGNKRIGHAAMELFLILNGMEIQASTAEQEQLILAVASSKLDRAGFTEWLADHLVPLQMDQ